MKYSTSMNELIDFSCGYVVFQEMKILTSLNYLS